MKTMDTSDVQNAEEPLLEISLSKSYQNEFQRVLNVINLRGDFVFKVVFSEEKAVDTVDGHGSKRKQETLRRKILVREQLEEFASSTTLHGLGYITRRSLTTIEKIFWLIAFCASVAICVYQIHNVWLKWHNSPVIVSINDELISVSQVPFPSVTICPQRKVFAREYNYNAEKNKVLVENQDSSENASTMSIEERKMFEDVSLLCDKFIFERDDILLLNRNYSNAAVVDNIYEAIKHDRTYFMYGGSSTWRQETLWNVYLWNPVVTKEGVCYNFNSLGAEDIFRTDVIQTNYSYIDSNQRSKNWTFQNGYDLGFPDDPYPRRGRVNGAEPDLVVILEDNLKDIDTECNVLYSGYKVFVQHPADMPQSELYSYALLPHQSSSFALKFSVMSSSPKLREYTPEVRRCYFPEDRYLRYFKLYTENNCKIECLSNYTFEMCGCVGFYMPRETSERICTIQKRKCMELALEKMAAEEEPGMSWDSAKCNCLPPCDSVEYDAEILKTEFNIKQYIQKDMERVSANESYPKAALSKTSYSRLEMYFKRPRFLSMRRSELFGTTDFIANCGGLLGLFLGFSFLSLLEIIYFASLRLWCTFRRDLEADK